MSICRKSEKSASAWKVSVAILPISDLNKDKFPKRFNPLADVLPAEIDNLFDKAIAAAKAGDEDALLENLPRNRSLLRFPKTEPPR